MRKKSLVLASFFMTLSAKHHHNLPGDPPGVSAVIAGQVIASDNTRFNKKNTYYERINYTNGGLTFTYPANQFSAAPIVNLGLLLNLSFSASTRFQPIVTANSATSTTVRVYKQTGSSNSEASTNDVEVQLWASEQ